MRRRQVSARYYHGIVRKACLKHLDHDTVWRMSHTRLPAKLFDSSNQCFCLVLFHAGFRKQVKRNVQNVRVCVDFPILETIHFQVRTARVPSPELPQNSAFTRAGIAVQNDCGALQTCG
jgi:hypothetical protein